MLMLGKEITGQVCKSLLFSFQCYATINVKSVGRLVRLITGILL